METHQASRSTQFKFDAWRDRRSVFVSLAIVAIAGVGWYALRYPSVPRANGGPADPPPAKPSRMFHQWPKDRQPDVVLVMSGQQFGYLQPCGCSKPQYGGLERRFNFMQSLTKERGWKLAAIDLGDIAAEKSGPQNKLKYRYSMEALKLLRYGAVGVGHTEMSLPLIDALAEYALNNASPRVLLANLKDMAQYQDMVYATKVVVATADFKIGVVGAVGPSIVQNVKDPSVAFEAVAKILPAALKEIDKEKPALRVLLYNGSPEEAKNCARVFNQFDIILALSPEEEAREIPEKVGATWIVTVGHKGRSLGLMGLYRTNNRERPLEMHYQLVPIGPEYETPEGKDKDNPILGLLEDYAREVHKRNYLALYPQIRHPIQSNDKYKDSVYVGSEKCQKCHEEAYKIWKATPHSHAYQTLVTAKRPSLRQYDGECIKCHVTGFGYISGFQNEKATPLLKNVGCENCHGPGSMHVRNHQSNKPDKELDALMNPYRMPPNETPDAKKQRMLQIDLSCQKCHDSDNDVNWKIEKWTTGKIEHREPRE